MRMKRKTCTKCKAEKFEEDFYKDANKKDGLKSWCKDCHLEDNKKREEKYNETRRNYRKEHSEECKENKRRYYKNNKEKILKNNKKWQQTFSGRLMSYIKGAKVRKIHWLLTNEEFKSFWGKRCSYCGDEIKTIGIDRIDNKKPYELNNCRPCCTICNKMKMNLSESDFLNMVKKIHKNMDL